MKEGLYMTSNCGIVFEIMLTGENKYTVIYKATKPFEAVAEMIISEEWDSGNLFYIGEV